MVPRGDGQVTKAETALVELVLHSNGSPKSDDLRDARGAVLAERLASLNPAIKARWQAAYRQVALSRRNLQAETEACLLPEGLSLDPWRREVEEALG